MADKMLIDASHEEETRVVVVRGNRIEEFDFESQHKKQLRGNIYLAKVTRVEPSLQAAFVDYGGNRHGFLAFAEIHPDYYQIPLADRQALLEAEAARNSDDDDDDDETPDTSSTGDLAEADQPDANLDVLADDEKPVEKPKKRRPRRKSKAKQAIEADAAEADESDATAAEANEEPGEAASASEEPVAEVTGEVEPAAEASAEPEGEVEAADADAESGEDDGDGKSMAMAVDADSVSEDVETIRGRRNDDDDDDGDDDGEKEQVESVGAEDAMEEVPDRASRNKPRKQYRIQEVIKRRQILLVQVAKEERGNKGAALTTYLSLAGRYSVLMPNTARGGGISRKITNVQDRKRLKEIARGLEVPQGMGVILRTAGANRTKVEIKRDFEYLMRLWENVRTLTLSSTAPCLVHEEGSLIKRSIRDLYNKDISEVIVAGEDGYREAKDFMKMLMPSHAKVVQPYRDPQPIFARSGIEAQLDRMVQPQVTLKSGGYLIINQTEALVAIDVNSGRSTREHSIEETALATNLEAAEEVARQLRLRDLAGLVVIDFIDMEEKRNNRSVEKRLKDCLKDDRARIQVGRISHFGLLEMSRQRIRASVLESTMQVCSHCGGTGHVRSQSSVALHVLRGVEEYLLKNTTHDITVRTAPETALYLLNHKRATIVEYEARFGVSIIVEADDSLGQQHFAIDRGEAVENPVKIEALRPVEIEEDDDDIVIEEEALDEIADEQENGDQQGRKRKRRRRRRGRRDGQNGDQQGSAHDADDGEDGGDDEESEGNSQDANAEDAQGEDDDQPRRKRRRRGKRGGRRNRNGEEGENGAESDASGDDEDGELVAADGEAEASESDAVTTPETAEVAAEADVDAEAAAAVDATETPEEKPAKPKRPRRTKKAKAEAEAETKTEVAEDAATEAVEQPLEAAAEEAIAEPAVEEPVVEAATEDAAEEQEKAPSRTARTSASSGPIATEPVLTSGSAADGEAKPKKGGWWQRKGFF